ncbi:MAG: PorT family protein [Ferruginibacter sp.]|nr:PorT family protein [Chitinophagaceae bacterium]
MKKGILGFVVLFVVLTANSQVKFGAKAGLNNSTLGGDGADISGKKSNTGFNVGVIANIPISTDFAFQPEIMYSGNQGMEFRPSSTSETNYNLNYINIPLMVQYKCNGFYGEVGPYFGFLTSGKVKTKTGTTTTENDIKEIFDGTDMGAAAGVGYMLKSGLGFGARYNMGLQNIYDATTPEFKNRYWQVNLIYMFSPKMKKKG